MSATIGVFPSRVAAERERSKYVAALKLTDRISALVTGWLVEPEPEAVLRIVVDDEKFLLVYDDPSAPEAA